MPVPRFQWSVAAASQLRPAPACTMLMPTRPAGAWQRSRLLARTRLSIAACRIVVRHLCFNLCRRCPACPPLAAAG